MHALETHEPSYIDGLARPFFIYLRPTVHRKSQGMQWRHRNPPGREAGSGAVGHTALRSPPLQEAGTGAAGHAAL
jgi:hypothetical protein